MRWPRSSLTVRGNSMFAAGVATGIGAILLGETALLRVAITIILLVLVCWAWVELSRVRIHTSHRVSRPRTPVGVPIEVQISLSTRSALPLLSSLECADHAGDGTGAAPALVVAARAARAGVSMRYTFAPKTRGRHRIGPLRVTMTDPFGLASAAVTGVEYTEVVALPAPEDLSETHVVRQLPASSGTLAAQLAGTDTQLDASLRDHQQQDGLRRVHWRSSARQGKLMVRQDQHGRRRRAAIVIDDRDRVHDDTTFEQLISVAASVGVQLLDSGYELAAYTSEGEMAPGGTWTADAWLCALALAQPSTAARLAPPAGTAAPDYAGGPVFLLLTAGSAPDQALLRRAVDQTAAATAIVVVPPAGAAGSDMLRKLGHHRWRVATLPVGGSLAASLSAMGGGR